MLTYDPILDILFLILFGLSGYGICLIQFLVLDDIQSKKNKSKLWKKWNDSDKTTDTIGETYGKTIDHNDLNKIINLWDYQNKK